MRPPTSLSEWAGVHPGDNKSAGKRKRGKTASGDRWIRRTLSKRGHAAAMTPSHFARAFKGIKARRGYKRAVVAIARELLWTMFFLISRNDVHRDRVVDYAAPFLKKVLTEVGGRAEEAWAATA
ncbi:MAG: transposase [Deltaproteobacteria bacterium]|nr:transposase [Deltaproteobacteria bacterium]